MDRSALSGVSWEDLAVLLAAAEHVSLSEAAAALRIGQSTASRRLMRLEAQLGTPVFDRTPRGMVLTAFGEALLPHAQLIAGHMDDIVRLASGQELHPRGQVRLALPDGMASTVLVPSLESLYARYPELGVDLISGAAVLDLVRREADLALRFVRPTQGDLLMQEIARVPLAPHIHPRLAGTPAQALRWLMLDDPGGGLMETRWIDDHIRPTRVMRISSWDALFAAAREGLGAAILSPMVAAPVGLLALPVDAPPVGERALFLVYHRALRDVPRVMAVRDWLLERVAEILAASA